MRYRKAFWHQTMLKQVPFFAIIGVGTIGTVLIIPLLVVTNKDPPEDLKQVSEFESIHSALRQWNSTLRSPEKPETIIYISWTATQSYSAPRD